MIEAIVIVAAAAAFEVQQTAGYMGIEQLSVVYVLEFSEAALSASVAQ